MVMGDGGKKKLFLACDGSQGLAKLSLKGLERPISTLSLGYHHRQKKVFFGHHHPSPSPAAETRIKFCKTRKKNKPAWKNGISNQEEKKF